MPVKTIAAALGIVLGLAAMAVQAANRPYAIAPTGQQACYDAVGKEIRCTGKQEALGGQDRRFTRETLRYRPFHDDTVLDINTGLIWQRTITAKVTWQEAVAGAAQVRTGGHSDWRLPTIKELYSLMDFSGSSPVGLGRGRSGTPFIDISVFEFRYGNPALGERPIDAQYWSATEYRGRTMGGNETVFGVNFADGRIKGYPKAMPGRGEHRMFVRYVRGNPDYGRNDFVDNGNGTITDRATGLMWMQVDSGHLGAGPFGDGRMDWVQALAWAGSLNYAGYSDWRLPNAKELQSLVDYSRSPQATDSAAISPLFKVSAILDEGGRPNYPFYWSSTTHLDGPRPGGDAVYVAFGEALGFMALPGRRAQLMDVHGAGAQRSDPKQGNPADHPMGHGPQGDVRRIYNHVRLVRDGG